MRRARARVHKDTRETARRCRRRKKQQKTKATHKAPSNSERTSPVATSPHGLAHFAREPQQPKAHKKKGAVAEPADSARKDDRMPATSGGGARPQSAPAKSAASTPLTAAPQPVKILVRPPTADGAAVPAMQPAAATAAPPAAATAAPPAAGTAAKPGGSKENKGGKESKAGKKVPGQCGECRKPVKVCGALTIDPADGGFYCKQCWDAYTKS